MDVMTTIAISGACFIGGAIAGGYLVSRKLTDEFAKWRSSLEEENSILHDERNRVKEKLEETIARYSEETDEKVEESGLRNMKDKADELSRKYRDPDFEEHFASREYPEEDSDLNLPPFQISEEELDVYPDSELIEMSYYQGDQTLMDDRGERVGYPELLFGEMVAEALPYTEDDLIYVHNSGQDANYEIHIYHGTSETTY